jgi:hypothetical protein
MLRIRVSGPSASIQAFGHVDIGDREAELAIEIDGLWIVPENVEREAPEALRPRPGLRFGQGLAPQASAAQAWTNPHIVDEAAAVPKVVDDGQPRDPYRLGLPKNHQVEQSVVGRGGALRKEAGDFVPGPRQGDMRRPIAGEDLVVGLLGNHSPEIGLESVLGHGLQVHAAPQ